MCLFVIKENFEIKGTCNATREIISAMFNPTIDKTEAKIKSHKDAYSVAAGVCLPLLFISKYFSSHCNIIYGRQLHDVKCNM